MAWGGGRCAPSLGLVLGARMACGWIIEENLPHFLNVLGWIVGYAFDGDDWSAISFGIRDTDQEAGRWYRYSFQGRQRIELEVARDLGSSVVQLRLANTPEQEALVQLAVTIFAHFRLRE
jgi:hypothetical protein